jgi:hypothetical protein
MLDLGGRSQRLIDGKLQQGGPLPSDGVGVAGLSGFRGAIGRQPLGALLGLQAPLATHLHDKGFGLQFGESFGTWARTVAPALRSSISRSATISGVGRTP